MRRLALLCSLLLPAAALAQRAAAQSPSPSPVPPRLVTVTAGFGNSMGGFGIQAEKYLARTRLSVLGGIGYLPAAEAGDYSGLGVAAGLRGFTPGSKHRGFLELSVSPLFFEKACFDDCSLSYGPALQAGWHFVTRGGFSLWISGGVGVALSTPPGEDSVAGVGGLGLGYTWRRSGSVRPTAP